MGKQITEKELAKKGEITFEHTDDYGIKYILKIFEIGLICTVRVFSKNEDLLYHNESAFTEFEKAKSMYEETKKTILDKDSFIHSRFARKCTCDYEKIKKQVETWIKTFQRPFQPGDCQNIANSWENRTAAFDLAYTAACYYANDPSESSFAKRNNFRVDFVLK